MRSVFNDFFTTFYFCHLDLLPLSRVLFERARLHCDSCALDFISSRMRDAAGERREWKGGPSRSSFGVWERCKLSELSADDAKADFDLVRILKKIFSHFR
jgi:hypothetical protein